MEEENIDFKNIPLNALRQKGRLLLSKLLNPIKILPSEEGYPRDWRGIAYLAGIQNINNISLTFKNDEDAMSKVIKIWCNEHKLTATFDNLRLFIGIIDRWDVNDDISEILDEDAKEYFKNVNKEKESKTENSTNEKEDMLLEAYNEEKYFVEDNIITKDDIIRARNGLLPQLYDAFVLYADEDIDFATELIEKMENYGLKLCVKERDFIGGISFEYEAVLKLISERCNRLIVIVSPSFLKSRANKFFVNFAQALGIDQGRRKIVPCLYEQCVLPPTLNFYFLLNYQRSNKLWNFWEKLRDSIQRTPIESNKINYALSLKESTKEIPKIQITEVVTNTSQDDVNNLNNNNEISLYSTSIKKIDDENDNKNYINDNKLNSYENNLNKKIKSEINDLDESNNKLMINSIQKEFNLRVKSLNNLNNLQQQQLQNNNSNNKQELPDNNPDLTKSNLDISELKTLNASEKLNKSNKWYKKFLSLNSVFDSTTTSSSQPAKPPTTTILKPKNDKKTKKHWFKKKLTSAVNS